MSALRITLPQAVLVVLRELLFRQILNLIQGTDDKKSGWSIYTSAIAGSTPCVTSAPVAFITPSSTGIAGASVSVVTNQLFTFKYPLAAKSTKLATGAIAGIAIGSFSGLALALAATALLTRTRRAKARAEREAATVSQSETNTKGRSELDPTSPHDGKSGVSELPSPHSDNKGMSELPSPHGDSKGVSELPNPRSPTLPERPFWTPTSPSGMMGEVFEMAAAPPAEMEGDVYMDEHHPAHEGQSPSAGEKGPTGSVKLMVAGEEVQRGEEVEAATPAYTPTSGKVLGPGVDEPYGGNGALEVEEEGGETPEGDKEEDDANPN